MKDDDLDNCGRGGNAGGGNGSSTPPPNNTTDNWLTIWEVNMIAELEKSLTDPENNSIQAETQLCSQKIWQSFQNCATAVAQVYVERGNSANNSGTTGDLLPSGKSTGAEEAFRLAAHHATTLYKDGVESCRRVGEIGLRQGQAIKTKDILQWVKRRRRFIRRDELIAMLAGSSSLPHLQQQARRPSSLNEDHHHHYYHMSKNASGAFGMGAGLNGGGGMNTTSTLTNISQPTNKPLLDSSNSFLVGFNPNLDFTSAASTTDSFSTFRAAVVSSHLGGASNRRPSPPPNNHTDNILFSTEFQPRKRTSQLEIDEEDDDDINMDSPNSHQQPKRGRFY